MKILVIGSARTRSTVLLEMLRTSYPTLSCFYEFYTYRRTHQSVESISSALDLRDDFILKILGHNIDSINDIPKLNLKRYDLIYLIGRKNYYHQCCSLQVSLSSKIWHDKYDNAFEKIKNLQFELSPNTVDSVVNDVAKFCMIENYLKQHSIDYTFYWYETLFESMNIPQKNLRDSQLDYESLISNYHELQPMCKKIFDQNFIYRDQSIELKNSAGRPIWSN